MKKLLEDVTMALALNPIEGWLERYVHQWRLEDSLKSNLVLFESRGHNRYQALLTTVRTSVIVRVVALLCDLKSNQEGAVNEKVFQALRRVMVDSITNKEYADALPLPLQKLVRGMDLETPSSMALSLIEHFAVHIGLALEKYEPV